MDGITSLAVNPASTLAVVGGASGSLRVVSLSKGEVVGALGGHTEGDSVEAVQFVDLGGPGGGSGVVVTGATDGKACIWDLSTMRLRATMEHKVMCIVCFKSVVILIRNHELSGCCNLSERAALSKRISPRFRVSRQNTPYMGYSYGHSHPRTQRTPGTNFRCCVGIERRCGSQCWRRWGLSCFYHY